MPPHKFVVNSLVRTSLYTCKWFITEEEYHRLNKLFERDFLERCLGVTTPLVPCDGCGGKYSELIDWFGLLYFYILFPSESILGFGRP